MVDFLSIRELKVDMVLITYLLIIEIVNLTLVISNPAGDTLQDLLVLCVSLFKLLLKTLVVRGVKLIKNLHFQLTERFAPNSE